MLLSLLADCRSGSVDGTFKAMSRQWKQLFILMVNYRGAFIPVVFGWLLDKTEISYHVIFLLVIEAFQSRSSETLELFGRCNLKLKKNSRCKMKCIIVPICHMTSVNTDVINVAKSLKE